jgi:hypothetical protein
MNMSLNGISKEDLSKLEDLESPGEGIGELAQVSNALAASDVILDASQTVSDEGLSSQAKSVELIDYTKDLINNDENNISAKATSDTVPVYPEWNKMPVIKNQLEQYPNLCERVKTCVSVLDFKNSEDVEQYQSLLNQAQGESACIKLRNSIIKFSEQTGNFIALVIFDTFKFKRPL